MTILNTYNQVRLWHWRRTVAYIVMMMVKVWQIRALPADDNSAWLNRSETTQRDQLINTLLTKDYCHQGSAVPKTIEQHYSYSRIVSNFILKQEFSKTVILNTVPSKYVTLSRLMSGTVIMLLKILPELGSFCVTKYKLGLFQIKTFTYSNSVWRETLTTIIQESVSCLNYPTRRNLFTKDCEGIAYYFSTNFLIALTKLWKLSTMKL